MTQALCIYLFLFKSVLMLDDFFSPPPWKLATTGILTDWSQADHSCYCFSVGEKMSHKPTGGVSLILKRLIFGKLQDLYSSKVSSTIQLQREDDNFHFPSVASCAPKSSESCLMNRQVGVNPEQVHWDSLVSVTHSFGFNRTGIVPCQKFQGHD